MSYCQQSQLILSYPEKIDGVIIMFALPEKKTWESAQSLIQSSPKKIGKVPTIVVGNTKNSDTREVSSESVISFLKPHSVSYVEITATNFDDVKKVVQTLIKGKNLLKI